MTPIITSLLDIDFYKFTMGQIVFKYHPDTEVKYAFTNRTKKVRIADIVDETKLRAELDHVRTLRLNDNEINSLESIQQDGQLIFSEDYLNFLKILKLPEYHLEKRSGSYILEFPGRWQDAIYWETIALSIVNELYYDALMKELTKVEKEKVFAKGKLLLAQKIETLRKHPKITFIEFGTRRRFSKDWQYYVTETLAKELPKQFLGTSNTYIATKHGLMPMGTSAHEMYMVFTGIMYGTDESVLKSHNMVLQEWWKEYGYGLSVALTDTFGTDFFFRDMTIGQAILWKGLRQDSGNPIVFGEKALKFYQDYGIDPKGKLLIFSDGLDIDTIVKIHNHFSGRIKTGFGWGTNLTNDVGFEPLSLVVKPVEANGNGLVKLSDNLAKAIGKPEDIKRFKHIFGYKVTTTQECRY